MSDIVDQQHKSPSVQAESKDASKSDARFQRIDHIALAVLDIEEAIRIFRDVLGFDLRRRRHIQGVSTGMISAELECNGIRFVLCQGTESGSQVSQLIKEHGIGVAHVALAVDDVDFVAAELSGRGLQFDTSIIRGTGLTQVFSARCSTTGLSFEIIQRHGEEEFLESNVQELFDQLERSGKY